MSLSGVTKTYQLHQRPSDRLRELMGLGRPSHVIEHKALAGIDLSVQRGETVGLLGVNGAGKSTLLQIVTGTLQPTTGSVETRGRIAALLELGAGFNPAWSGRKNAEFQCVMQQIPKADMPRVMAAIEAFADIGPFFDEPAQTYSSGMYMRVAFAASVAVDPDILIVDEALAVGDVRFQNKCFRRFEELQSNGTTILFVTHAPDLVNRFCTRGIVLNAGNLCFDGSAAEATREYLAMLGQQPNVLTDAEHESAEEVAPEENTQSEVNNQVEAINEWPKSIEDYECYNPEEKRTGSMDAKIVNAVVRSSDGAIISTIAEAGTTVHLDVALQTSRPLKNVEIGIIARATDGILLFGTTNEINKVEVDLPIRHQPSIYRWTFKLNIQSGYLFIDLGLSELVDGNRIPLDWRQSVLSVPVSGQSGEFGMIYTDLSLAALPQKM